MAYEFLRVEKAAHPERSTAKLCRLLQVSRSGYYDWVARQAAAPTGRAAENEQILAEIETIHDEFGYYGSPRIHRELLARGHTRAGVHRVAKLMRTNGIRARRGKIKSRPRAAPPARRVDVPDLIARNFHADAPDAVWFTDQTMIRTGQGWLYATVILDAFNREVISYTTADQDSPTTAWTALHEAIRARKPPRGCIIHSDRGYQFTAHQWFTIANHTGLRVSMGRRGDALDNAAIESWFSSYKSEELYPNGQPATRREARQRLFGYVYEYNTRRRHSTLGYAPPATYTADSSTCP